MLQVEDELRQLPFDVRIDEQAHVIAHGLLRLALRAEVLVAPYEFIDVVVHALRIRQAADRAGRVQIVDVLHRQRTRAIAFPSVRHGERRIPLRHLELAGGRMRDVRVVADAILIFFRDARAHLGDRPLHPGPVA